MQKVRDHLETSGALVSEIEYVVPGNGTLRALLQDTANGRFNMSIAGITITSEREQVLDFSHSYFRGGIGILIPKPTRGNPLGVVTSVVFWNAICVVLLLSYIFAVLVWCAEHQTNPDFQPAGYDADEPEKLGRAYVVFEGLWQSIWFAVSCRFVCIFVLWFASFRSLTLVGFL